ncbi:unnamed protein product [Moneuplotes crassus]|uniref:Large ribosomal subunit protein mL49 n=1 Tax=Euplotes crassus TaxID=5936 RepID=A0AAD1Y0X4_EUPCR|nr:unnamed protein product [Moneuplotes crassus]
MSTHFFKSFIKNTGSQNIRDKMIRKMIVRKPYPRMLKGMHPNVRKLINRTTQAPVPLTYKLQELPTPDTTLDEPLGVSPEVPFEVKRTFNGNLPVYTKFTHDGNRKLTVVRHLYGDVDSFKEELAKICSNHEIFEKVGRVEVKGLHKEKVDLWLRRLGF